MILSDNKTESFWHQKYLVENKKLLITLEAFTKLVDAAKERDLSKFQALIEDATKTLQTAIDLK